MIGSRHKPARVVPARAIPGGRIVVESGHAAFPVEDVPRIWFGSTEVRPASASSRRLVLVVPAAAEAGPVPIRLADQPPIGSVEVGKAWATGLHQVDSPVFDRDGNLYVTFSGTRGQHVPVSVFRVRPGWEPEAVASGIVNATSLAFDPFGELCVTSRFDGSVYRVKVDGTVEKIASDLGVACGLAFAPDGTMFVGDRTGTLFRVNAAGRAAPFATLPSSIAAFHLAIGPEEDVYVTAPTLATHDPVYRVDRRGEVSVFAEGFGRPQGLAVDDEGTLYVADSLAGASGIFRVRPGRRREILAAGDGVIGLAFHPSLGVAVASGDAVYVFDPW
jgi:glucose/arabinose dehydrogenase